MVAGDEFINRVNSHDYIPAYAILQRVWGDLAAYDILAGHIYGHLINFKGASDASTTDYELWRNLFKKATAPLNAQQLSQHEYYSKTQSIISELETAENINRESQSHTSNPATTFVGKIKRVAKTLLNK